MDIELPPAIINYFAADKGGHAKAVSEWFTEAAVLNDEGRTYNGRDAIERWMSKSAQKYSYTVEPFAIVTKGDRVVVTSHLTGEFPGSPLDLRYMFVLAGEKIAELEIVL